jgi:uroporphyrinogen-III decarboxylase
MARSVASSPDSGKTARQLYSERSKRLQDAMELKQPDRIPIQLTVSYMLAEIGGITKQELVDNPAKAQELLERAALEYQPDTIFGTLPSDPRPNLLLGDRMTRWPGRGISPNAEFQFVESEFMKAEDYDDFLEDPADWGIRVYLPRAFSALEGFADLAPLGMHLFGTYNIFGAGALTAPKVAAAFQAYAKAAQIVDEDNKRGDKNTARMKKLGFPQGFVTGSIIEAPFDFMSDTLRGMRGIMLDILQRPEKLLAAEEKVSRFQLESAIDFSRATGIKRAFIPLHRGSDGFMSLPQFERFYWPQLKNMMLTLVDNGIMPSCFYEGVWDERLTYLAELPRGKTAGWFQRSDIFKVKEIVGKTMCIMGGMPNTMLQGGTAAEVRRWTKRVCEIVGKGGGFIMSTGVGEMSGSKPELVKAWVEATHEYGRY